MRFNSYIFALLLLLIFSSCEIINKAELIPSYIRIDKIDLTTNYTSQGSNSHKITDAWVYIDDQLIGAFELPATIPVLKEGTHELKVRAGIKVNGISSTRGYYPFYQYYSEVVNLTRGEILSVSPTVSYNSYTTFPWLEDFEGAAFSIVDSINTDTVMKIINADVFQGNKAGAIYLEDIKTRYFGRSTNSFTLPKLGAPVYLELNYKTNNMFSIGIYAGNSGIPLPSLYINPSENWNKIYVELTPLISDGNNSNPFKIYFAMQKDNAVDNAFLYVDNIKLVH